MTGDKHNFWGHNENKIVFFIYECIEVRRRVHATGDEYIQVPRGQETSTYDRR